MPDVNLPAVQDEAETGTPGKIRFARERGRIMTDRRPWEAMFEAEDRREIIQRVPELAGVEPASEFYGWRLSEG